MHDDAAVTRCSLGQELDFSMPQQLWSRAVTKKGKATHQVSAYVNVGAGGQPLCKHEGIVVIVLQPLC